MCAHAVERLGYGSRGPEWQAGDYRSAGEYFRVGREHDCRHRSPGRQAGNKHTVGISAMARVHC